MIFFHLEEVKFLTKSFPTEEEYKNMKTEAYTVCSSGGNVHASCM